jgi:hypothetical protein
VHFLVVYILSYVISGHIRTACEISTVDFEISNNKNLSSWSRYHDFNSWKGKQYHDHFNHKILINMDAEERLTLMLSCCPGRNKREKRLRWVLDSLNKGTFVTRDWVNFAPKKVGEYHLIDFAHEYRPTARPLIQSKLRVLRYTCMSARIRLT